MAERLQQLGRLGEGALRIGEAAACGEAEAASGLARALAKPRRFGLEQRRAETSGGGGETPARAFDEDAERAAEARRRAVEALGGQRQQLIGARQAAGEIGDPAAALLARPRHRLDETALQSQRLCDEIGAHRHRHLGGGGRGRGAAVGGVVDERRVGLVADGGDERDGAGGGGAHHRFVGEGQQVLDRTAAARDDEDVRARDRAAGFERVEAGDGGGDLRRRALPLHGDRPDEDAAREAIGEAVENVADDRADRRGDDADHLRQMRQRLFAGGVEEAFGGEPGAPFLQHLHDRADAGEFEPLDDDLIRRFARIGGEAAGGDDLHPLLRLHLQLGIGAAPDDGVDLRALVLQREIGVARGMDAAKARDLAAHPDIAEAVLDGALQRLREFADGEFQRVRGGRLKVCVGHGALIAPAAAAVIGAAARVIGPGDQRAPGTRQVRMPSRA